MKTIFQINTVINSGSTGRIVEKIGQLAIHNGWNSYIAYGRNERPSKSKLLRIGNDLGIKIHGIKTRLFDKHGLGSAKATRKLIAQLIKIKPDIIHLHNLHGYYLNIEILFKYLASCNIPIVWTIHDCWPITGHCTHFDYIGCKKWKTECFSCPQKKEYPASFCIDRSRKNYKLKKEIFNSIPNLTIVSVSNWLKNVLEQSILKELTIQQIYNGIDLNVFTPTKDTGFIQKYKLNEKFIVLGVASVWSQKKGLDDFIKLSQKLTNDTAIILIGLSAKQIKSLPKNIIGIERTENMADLVKFYSMADVYINTSSEETFGLTSIEAQACGTPSIVYNSTANPETVNKDSGFIVKKGDINDLLKAIKKIKKNGKQFYSEHCLNQVSQNFNSVDRYQDYINLYNELSNS